MILIFIIVYLLALVASWLLTCGVIKLITLCFGLTFTWPIATGIWLVLWLVGSVINRK